MLKPNYLRYSFTLLLLSWLTLTSYAQTAPPPVAPAPWTTELREFARQDSLKKPPIASILFYGSSSIRMWETLATDFPNQPVLNRGFGGSRFPDAIQLFDKLVVRYRPRQVVLYEGDNDIAAGVTPQQVYASFLTFEKLMRQKLPQSQLVFLSIKPSLARWAQWPQMQAANNLIRQYSKAHPKQVRFVDVGTPMLGTDGKPRPELFREDGLHMTRAGYEIWTQVVAPVLAK
ncbi:lipolytic protein G-D-S-L family [Hymenobacter roseosalivarius DSM 11622]|uniref:Lipolytic protein G-D-S-L family n=1 Tax=Hymenobacter roseosalivarius DSM 11622 TaxID=645990 RepID=A0A1W1V1W5_9BACT|nr:SGNH/GDSL hydrolase family protein [Hymenobacter roseosalivarius]SMB87014.1 lipolytic protein G-D-S-L family [Hymenobacter roseosalivarius DSM 11622]